MVKRMVRGSIKIIMGEFSMGYGKMGKDMGRVHLK